MADFFCLGGTLSVASASYIPRRADHDIIKALTQGEHALVLDSRQKGKSSLLARAAHELRTKGSLVIKLDLQRFGSSVSSEQWYAALFHSCAEQLDDQVSAREYWATLAHVGPAERWIRYLEHWSHSAPLGLVVFIDEIDYVRSLNFDTDEFFATIRSSRASGSSSGRLTFCFCGASTPTGLVRNPANGQMITGKMIQLDDFTYEETKAYSRYLDSQGVSGEQVLAKIYDWVSGHPFLTQIACAEWVRSEGRKSPSQIDDFFEDQLALVGTQYRSDHLIAVTKALLNPTNLKAGEEQNSTMILLKSLARITGKRRVRITSVREDVSEYLLLCGVVQEQHGNLKPRNRLYARALEPTWIRQHLPQNLVLLERRATRRAYLRAGIVSSLGLALFGGLALRNYYLATSLSANLAQSRLDEIRAQREAYVGAMQSVSADISDGNYMRAGLLIDQLANSPFIDWEWSFLNSKLGQYKKSWTYESPITDWMIGKNGEPEYLLLGDGIDRRASSNQVKHISSFTAPMGPVLSSSEAIIQKERHQTQVVTSDGRLTTYPYAVLTVRNGLMLCSSRLTGLLWVQKEDGTRLTEVRLPPSESEVGFGYLWTDTSKCVIRTQASIIAYDFRTSKMNLRIPDLGVVNDIAVLEQENEMIVATDDPVLKRFSLASGKVLSEFKGNSGPVRRCGISKDGRWLLTGGSDGVIRRFSLPSGELVSEYLGHRDSIQNLRISEDQKSFYTSSLDRTIKQWPVSQGLYPLQMGSPTFGFARIKLAQGSNHFLVGYDKGVLQQIDSKQTRATQVGKFPPGSTLASCEPLKSNGFVAVSQQKRLLALRSGFSVSQDLVGSGIPKYVTSEDDEDNVLVAFTTGEVWSFNLLTNRQTRMRSASGVVTAFARSSDSQYWAIALRDATVELRSKSSALIKTLDLDDARYAMALQFSPDGKLLAIPTAKGDVKIFRSDSGAHLRTLKGHQLRIWRATFSSDGRMLATASFDNTARVWDVESGKEVQSILHKSWVSDASFNPSDSRLLTTCGDGSARLWDTKTWREVLVLTKQNVPLFGGKFSSDGNSIVVMDSIGGVFLWQRLL